MDNEIRVWLENVKSENLKLQSSCYRSCLIICLASTSYLEGVWMINQGSLVQSFEILMLSTKLDFFCDFEVWFC